MPLKGKTMTDQFWSDPRRSKGKAKARSIYWGFCRKSKAGQGLQCKTSLVEQFYLFLGSGGGLQCLPPGFGMIYDRETLTWLVRMR